MRDPWNMGGGMRKGFLLCNAAWDGVEWRCVVYDFFSLRTFDIVNLIIKVLMCVCIFLIIWYAKAR